STAEAAENYRLDPPVKVDSAKLSDDGTTVTVALAEHMDVATTYRLTMTNVADASPASNRIALKEPLPVVVSKPVYSLDLINVTGKAKNEKPVPGLPVRAKDPWTINLFVRTDQSLENRTVIAGFGRAEDTSSGIGRYLCKFGRGLHFWAS